MVTGKDLQIITQARLKTAKILIKAKDWDGAAYSLGYVLECALKAAVCSSLKLALYPEKTALSGYKSNEKAARTSIPEYFMTHDFLQLLVVSGLQKTFSLEGPAKSWENWSNFTIEYSGNWTEMRYDPNREWTEEKVKKLYKALISSRNAIIKEIKKKW